MLFAPGTCVNKKTPPTHSVHWDLNPSPLQNIIPSFLPSPFLNLQTIQAPLFRQKIFMHPTENQIFQ